MGEQRRALDVIAYVCKLQIPVGHFPVPLDVKPLVDKAIISYVVCFCMLLLSVNVGSALFSLNNSVVAVLIKHNKLVGETKRFLSTPEGTPAPPNLVRVWKTPHKLRQWMLQKYQVRHYPCAT